MPCEKRTKINKKRLGLAHFFLKKPKVDGLCGELETSMTRLGDFWKFLVTKFLAKEAQMIGNFLG